MNIIKYGDFAQWPLGTSFSIGTGTTSTTLLPGWTFNKLHANQPAVVISRQTFSIGQTVPEGVPLYYLRINPTGAGTATAAATYARLTYTIPNGRYVSNRQLTVRFWAKASIAREIVVDFHRFFGTNGYIVAGGADNIVHGRQAVQLRATWQPFELKVRVPDVSGYTFNSDDTLALRFFLQGGSTYLGDDALLWMDSTVDISQVSVSVDGAIEYPKASGDQIEFSGSSAEVLNGAGSFVTRPVEFLLDVSRDEATDVTTGDGKFVFRTPFAFTLTSVVGTLSTTSSSGDVTADIRESGTTVLSTPITIEESFKTSVGAVSEPVISDSAIGADAEISIDVDGAGTGAKGLKIWLIGTRL